MAERMRRVASGEIVEYPVRVHHVDGSWMLRPTSDRRSQGKSERCIDPICSICHVCEFCLERPPVGLTDDLYAICEDCAEPASHNKHPDA